MALFKGKDHDINIESTTTKLSIETTVLEIEASLVKRIAEQIIDEVKEQLSKQ